jgi:hypothetical protein
MCGAWPVEEEVVVPVSERDYMDGLEVRFEVVNEQLRGFARVFYSVGEGSLRLDCIAPEQLNATGGVEMVVRLTHGPSATRTGVIEMVAALHTHTVPAPAPVPTPLTMVTPASPADTISPPRIMKSPSIESGEGDGEEYVDDFEEPPETPLAVAAARRGTRDLLGAVDDDEDGRGQELDDDIDDEDDEQQQDIINDGEGDGQEKAVPRHKFAWRRREIDFAVAKLYSVMPMDLDLSNLGIQLYDNPSAEARRTAKRAALSVVRRAAGHSLLAL